MASSHRRIFNKAQEQMFKAALELGMTPSSRTRVKATKALEHDEFEKFL